VKHLIRPAAREDILRQFQYYLLNDAPDVATRFLEAVDESIAAICSMPQMGAPRLFKKASLAGLRSWPVKYFDEILIFYIAGAQQLRVVRVLHGKRETKKILERDREEVTPN